MGYLDRDWSPLSKLPRIVFMGAGYYISCINMAIDHKVVPQKFMCLQRNIFVLNFRTP